MIPYIKFNLSDHHEATRAFELAHKCRAPFAVAWPEWNEKATLATGGLMHVFSSLEALKTLCADNDVINYFLENENMPEIKQANPNEASSWAGFCRNRMLCENTSPSKIAKMRNFIDPTNPPPEGTLRYKVFQKLHLSNEQISRELSIPTKLPSHGVIFTLRSRSSEKRTGNLTHARIHVTKNVGQRPPSGEFNIADTNSYGLSNANSSLMSVPLFK